MAKSIRSKRKKQHRALRREALVAQDRAEVAEVVERLRGVVGLGSVSEPSSKGPAAVGGDEVMEVDGTVGVPAPGDAGEDAHSDEGEDAGMGTGGSGAPRFEFKMSSSITKKKSRIKKVKLAKQKNKQKAWRVRGKGKGRVKS